MVYRPLQQIVQIINDAIAKQIEHNNLKLNVINFIDKINASAFKLKYKSNHNFTLTFFHN